jgi:hypothetical protein
MPPHASRMLPFGRIEHKYASLKRPLKPHEAIRTNLEGYYEKTGPEITKKILEMSKIDYKEDPIKIIEIIGKAEEKIFETVKEELKKSDFWKYIHEIVQYKGNQTKEVLKEFEEVLEFLESRKKEMNSKDERIRKKREHVPLELRIGIVEHTYLIEILKGAISKIKENMNQ